MGNVESKRLIINAGLFSATAAALAYIWLGAKPAPRITITSNTVIWEPSAPSCGDIRGYYNLGNSCYINSLLQALAASRHNVRYIANYFGLKKLCSFGDENHADFQIVSALSASNQYINCNVVQIDAELSRQIPEKVITTFKKWSQVSLATFEEQDVHEFFTTIMTAMLEEQKALQARTDFMNAAKIIETALSFPYRVSGPGLKSFSEGVPSSPTANGIDNDGFGIAKILSKNVTGTSIIMKSSQAEVANCPRSPTDLTNWNNPFMGRFASSFQCISCRTMLPIKFEDFTDITVTLPSKTNPTLHDLLLHYFNPTIVHSVDCPNCSTLTEKPTKSSFFKRTCISKFPRSLCIHINRVEWGKNGYSSKRFDFIPFPFILDMTGVSSFTDLMKLKSVSTERCGDVAEPNADGDVEIIQPVLFHGQPLKYKLMAVICHRGSVNTGHFVAYRLSPLKLSSTEEEWYLVSDTFIKSVQEDQVLLQHAYMLFYDRIEETA